MGRRGFVVFLMLLAFGGGVWATYTYLRRADRGAQFGKVQEINSPIPIKTDTRPLDNPGSIAEAAARVEPSVVTIDTEYRPQGRFGVGDFTDLDGEPQRVPRGSGSGVIISPDGVIVTNNHVVENATKISVTLQDGREMEGHVVGADALSDLAVVRVNEKDLPSVTMADSDKVKVGEWVVAVGNPLGVGTTVTAGIVSALRKGKSTGSRLSLASAIQTDAAINPGNSGGALADIQGRLIGINSAIISNTGGNVGIGFAIPINTVREIVPQLLEKGKVIRPWLGIAFGPITERARTALNIPKEVTGVIISDVLRSSPASDAGLQPADIVRRANDTEIKTPEDLQMQITRLKVGDTLRLTVWREGREANVTATLQERPTTLPER